MGQKRKNRYFFIVFFIFANLSPPESKIQMESSLLIMINKDPAAMAYLDNLQLLKIMSEKLGSNSVIRLIDGNLFTNPERIRQVLDMFVQNNMMTEAAALLEKAKNKNIKINNFDL